MNILQKIQNQPENIRKFILWTTVAFVALILFFFWLKNFQSKIESFKFEEKLNLPKLEMPKIETSEILEEELKKLEEMIEK